MRNDPAATFPTRCRGASRDLGDTSMEAVPVFNRTAQLIWDQCDEEHTVR